MSIGSALQIGRSGLAANRTAIEVTGHNLANIATEGYHRQRAELTPIRSQELQRGIFLGRGVDVQQVVRQVNDALEGRLRDGISSQAHSLARQDLLKQIEAIQNEFTDSDLSSHLSEFLNSWSQLANNPQDQSTRATIIQQGQSLAGLVRSVRTQYTESRVQLDRTIDAAVTSANDLLDRLAQINHQIVITDQGTGGAHGLRDQRDLLLSELAQYIDISTNEHENGSLDVFVGSIPLILNNQSRGLRVRENTVDGETTLKLALEEDNSLLEPMSGRLASLLEGREQDLNGAVEALDQFSRHLILEVNRLHSQGRGLEGFTSVTSSSRVADSTAALSTPEAGLEFPPTHGSFQIHTISTKTGLRETSTIQIDADGIDPANDTTLEDLVAQINAKTDATATITVEGRLRIDMSGEDVQLGFSDDSSGVLAALGINTFFTGSDAADLRVNDAVRQNPSLLAAGKSPEGADNTTAQAIASLRDSAVAGLNGASLNEFWSRHVEDLAVRVAQAQQQHEADTVVRESLGAQQQALSGVNADEEAINLLTFQRAYQGSARFLTVVDELIQTLLALV